MSVDAAPNISLGRMPTSGLAAKVLRAAESASSAGAAFAAFRVARRAVTVTAFLFVRRGAAIEVVMVVCGPCQAAQS